MALMDNQSVESKESGLSSCSFILFGATGDLTKRKIMPGLYSIFSQGLLPKNFIIVAFARRDKDDAVYREELRENMKQFAPKLPSEGEVWDKFAQCVYYVRSDFDDPEGYQRLANRLTELDRQHDLGGNHLFYLATPPDNFSEIIEHLGKAGLNNPRREGGWSRLIIEKPFGHDLESAKALNIELNSVFHENQVYRIDHYLGKEAVQNILVLRFANQIFEPLWNQTYIDNVQITVAETLGVEGRGGYFEQSGITRDIVQNHALQVLTLIAMEAPATLTADDIRDEKVKVLKSVRHFTPEDVALWTVRGQYGPGVVDGKTVPGYREEEGVNPRSETETFSAFKFQINNWRWSGVPFYVQAGKRMPQRVTEVKIQFKAVPDVLFANLASVDIKPNILSLRIQPDEGASLEIGSKIPGPEMKVAPVNMDFKYGAAFRAPIRDAYERLILDAIRGDAALFARNDEVELAWALITPIMEAWRDLSCPLFPNYAAGTWGPEAANNLLSGGRAWHLPV
jgi:glucose-6-phosphate 1-dehydrogenase